MNQNEEIIKILINELKSRGLIKEKSNAFKNTEILLYNYNIFKESIRLHNEQLQDLKDYGIPNKSKSITTMSTNVRKIDKNDQIDSAIKNLEQQIYKIKVFLKHIDRILKEFKVDPYYQIIELKYFNNKTIDEIAEIMRKDTSTISRNKNRLINEIKVKLLPNEIISEIINY